MRIGWGKRAVNRKGESFINFIYIKIGINYYCPAFYRNDPRRCLHSISLEEFE